MNVLPPRGPFLCGLNLLKSRFPLQFAANCAALDSFQDLHLFCGFCCGDIWNCMYQRRWRFQHLQLQTGNPVLSWIFSQQGLQPTFLRQWILLFLYQPYPHTLGNDDLGH